MMYRLLVQGVTDYAIFMLDPEGGIVNWNAGAERIKGYTADEIVGQHLSSFYGEEDSRAGVPMQNLRIALEQGRFEDEGWRHRKDGSRFWAHVIIDAIQDPDAGFIGFAKITRDCSERHAAAVKLETTLDKLDLALSNMSQGLCLLDGDGCVVLANARMYEMLALPGEGESLVGGAITKALRDRFGQDVATLFQRDHLRLDLDPAKPCISEVVHRGWTLSVRTRRLAAGGWVSTFVDVTERRRFEERIQHLALHDPLTGLANRAAFHRFLSEALALPVAATCTVVYIDLDRFKPINDTFGHAVGDRVLQEVASRLRRIVRREDMIARLGGDEFALIFRSSDPSWLEGKARQILSVLSRAYEIDGLSIRGGASIGIAVAPSAGRDPAALLRNADLALYVAKNDGRSRYTFYTPEMGDLAIARASLEADLRRALKNDEFLLHYQPIVHSETSAVIGYEVLLRWQPPDGEMISPATFVPVAEEAGLMAEIGAWVLAESCREAAGWPSHLTVSVNVSATQLRSGAFLQIVERALAVSGLAPHRLEIEITETAVLESRDVALDLLRQMRALGVTIALDDFGTGYSSLSFVHMFPLSRIKIDRSFVQGLGRDPQSTAIVNAIIGLSRSLGLAVTAEGVETEEQRRLLSRQGRIDLQGFLFGRPAPLPALAAREAAGRSTGADESHADRRSAVVRQGRSVRADPGQPGDAPTSRRRMPRS